MRCETFTSVQTGEERLVPVSLADVLIGTNGMAYGNDESEADQQALAELCERFANRIVITERLALPEFPRQALDPRLRLVIEELEERLGLVIRIRDASLGYGLPVISTLLEDPVSGRYFVKFGSHFDPSVATERCLTELFQGRPTDDLSFLRERAYVEEVYWQDRNLDSILHNGDGYYPPEYLVQVGVDPSSTWPLYLKSNDEAVQYMQSILGCIGGDVLKRVYLTDPGYVVRYLVPSVSELNLNGHDKIRWRCELDWVRKRLLTSGLFRPTKWTQFWISSSGTASMIWFRSFPCCRMPCRHTLVTVLSHLESWLS
ncbi:YcaO-like family protein [Arcanobacterium hippocoleae]